MQRYKIIITVMATALAMILFSCSKSIDPDGNNYRQDILNSDNEDPIGYSPADIMRDHPDCEAGLMSLWYCNKLVSDIDIYFRFHDGLTLLRDKFGDSIPEVAIPFFPPWVPGQLLVGMTDSANNEYENGRYTAWDYLNGRFFIKEIYKFLSIPDNHWYRLTFESVLNPTFLPAFYDTLPGITHAEANGYIGDWPCTYPWIINDTITFLVRDAWGDCPAGCIYSRFFYFKESSDGYDMIGIWESWHESEPSWWAEAQTAFFAYKYGRQDNKIKLAEYPVQLLDSAIEILPFEVE